MKTVESQRHEYPFRVGAPPRTPSTVLGACPGCGLDLPGSDGPSHPYYGASPACWELYGRALERAYGDATCRDVLQLVVDAYAWQHPGVEERRNAQSVGIHLMTLCLILEDGADPREGPKLHRRMVARPTYSWLDSPADRGRLTVATLTDAPTANAYADAARAWADDVWRAWRPHHDTVRAWLLRSMGA